jgi:hypothetical protein
MSMSLLTTTLATPESQPAAWTPVRSRTAVVDAEEDAPLTDSQHGKSKLPLLLANVSCSARNSAIKGAEKLTKFMKGGGEPTDTDEKVVQKYEFKTAGRCRELLLAHVEGVWHIKLDSEEVGTKAHSNSLMKSFHTSVDFPVPLSMEESGNMETLLAIMSMEWVPRSAKWQYTLQVNDVTVPACWSKASGFVQDYEVTEVVSDVDGNPTTQSI